jgi:DNA-binding transcriptional LysR family regulator
MPIEVSSGKFGQSRELPIGVHASGLDLNLLLVFDAVYRTGQVTRAAMHLGITPSAVSNALARLREHCQDRLFIRTKNQILPTPYADAVAKPIQDALEDIRRALERREGFTPATSERVFKINLADVGQMLMVGKLLPEFSRQAPKACLETTDLSVEHAQAAMEAGQIDLAVGHLSEIGDSFFRKKLVSETYVCVARVGHPHIRGELTLATYLDGVHVVYSPTAVSLARLNDNIQRMFAKQKVQQKIALKAAHSFGLSSIVSDSNLILTIPARLASYYASMTDVAIFPLPFALPPFDIHLYWHERAHRDPGHKWLRSIFVKKVR